MLPVCAVGVGTTGNSAGGRALAATAELGVGGGGEGGYVMTCSTAGDDVAAMPHGSTQRGNTGWHCDADAVNRASSSSISSHARRRQCDVTTRTG